MTPDLRWAWAALHAPSPLPCQHALVLSTTVQLGINCFGPDETLDRDLFVLS